MKTETSEITNLKSTIASYIDCDLNVFYLSVSCFASLLENEIPNRNFRELSVIEYIKVNEKINCIAIFPVVTIRLPQKNCNSFFVYDDVVIVTRKIT